MDRRWIGVFAIMFIVGLVAARSLAFGSNTSVTIVNQGQFVVANTYATNATFLYLTAGHWGENVSVSLGSAINSTSITFTVYQNYQYPNQTIIRQATTTLKGPMAGGRSSYIVLLDLGRSSISLPFYIDEKWTSS